MSDQSDLSVEIQKEMESSELVSDVDGHVGVMLSDEGDLILSDEVVDSDEDLNDGDVSDLIGVESEISLSEMVDYSNSGVGDVPDDDESSELIESSTEDDGVKIGGDNASSDSAHDTTSSDDIDDEKSSQSNTISMTDLYVDPDTSVDMNLVPDTDSSLDILDTTNEIEEDLPKELGDDIVEPEVEVIAKVPDSIDMNVEFPGESTPDNAEEISDTTDLHPTVEGNATSDIDAEVPDKSSVVVPDTDSSLEIPDTTNELEGDLPKVSDNTANVEEDSNYSVPVENTDIEIDYIRDFYDNFFGITTLPPGLMSTGLDSYMILQKNILKNCSMPWLVKRCCEVIIERGLHTVGIFRVPGGHSETEEILDAFNLGEVPDFTVMDVESVSSALKKYLRTLPRPLLSDDTIEEGIQNRVVQLWDLEDDEEKIELLKGVINDLSPFRKVTLKEFFHLLYQISLEHEINMMHSYNIATIFGGMVDIVSNMLPSGRKTDFCDFLISNYPAIFGERDFLKPCHNTDSSGKAKGVYVYLQDGTYSSKISKHDEKAGDTLKYIIGKQYLVKPYILSPSSYLYELQDSTWRRIELDEYIVPISERGSIILLSHLVDTTLDNGLDLSHFVIHEPTVYVKSTPEITETVADPEKSEEKLTSGREETGERPKSGSRKETGERPKSGSRKARFQNNRRSSIADFLTKKKKKRKQYDDSEKGLIEEFNEKEDGMIAKLTAILNFLNPLLDGSPVATDNDVITYRNVLKKAIRFHYNTIENVNLTGISEGYSHTFDTLKAYPKYEEARIKFMEIIYTYRDVEFISSTWSETYDELMRSPISHFADLVKIFEKNQNLTQEMEERIEYQKCIEFTNTLMNEELNISIENNEAITATMESFTDLPFSILVDGRKLIKEGSMIAHVLDRKVKLAVYLFNDVLLIGKKTKKERTDLEFYNISILRHLRVGVDEDLLLIYQLDNPIPILVLGYPDQKIFDSWKIEIAKAVEISKAMSRGQTKRVRNLSKLKKVGGNQSGLNIKTATSRKQARKSARKKSARKSALPNTSPVVLSDMPFDNNVLWEFFMSDPENGVKTHLKKRKYVWSGKDGVLWLVENNYATSNTEATNLLSDLLSRKGFFTLDKEQTEFLMSKNSLYYFYELEARKLPTMSTLLPEPTSKLGVTICGYSDSKDYQELLDVLSQQSNIVLEVIEKKTAEQYYQWLFLNRKDFKSKSRVSYFHNTCPFIYTTRSKKYLGTKTKFLESYNFHMETTTT